MYVIQGLLIFIYAIVALGSTIYFWRNFSASTFGVEARKLVLQRHVAYISFYLIMNIYVFLNSINVLTAHFEFQYQNNRITEVFKVIYFMQGYLLPFLRFLEPGFFKTVYTHIFDKK